VTINREGGVFANSLFVMQVLNAAVRLITGEPVFLFELRTIAARDYAADAELDPVLVLFGLFFGSSSGGLAVARITGPNFSGKSYRANQHEKSAR
jgi:hypothetical protein